LAFIATSSAPLLTPNRNAAMNSNGKLGAPMISGVIVANAKPESSTMRRVPQRPVRPPISGIASSAPAATVSSTMLSMPVSIPMRACTVGTCAAHRPMPAPLRRNTVEMAQRAASMLRGVTVDR
jgi:hypothetical protein